MEWVQDLVEQYGYWAVLFWTFIEGESALIIAAAFAAAGMLTTWIVIAVAACGAFLGHLFFFGLGRWRGEQIIHAIPSLKRHAPKANMILDKYAHWSIFIFQYLYGTRLAAAILFGTSSISFQRFFLLQIINCITWACVIYSAGHFLGLAAMQVLHQFGLWGLIFVLILLATVGAWLYWHYGHHYLKTKWDDTSDKKS
ncbi:MAG: VTT domain-containing protein [Mariprofundaceae bacterium]|nr:VTT domain-containing protein [Mariprofundaceae bacterium]